MLQSDIRRDERGIDRCNRKIFTAVQRVVGDDSKGYKNVEAICNQPIVQRISDGVKGCSRCDIEPPVGNVHPKTINSAMTNLTPKELEECGLKEDYTKLEQSIINTQAMEAPVENSVKVVAERPKNLLEILTNIEALEQCEDIPTMLITLAVDAMDKIPVSNYGESRRLDKVRQKMEALLTR
jgi:hypothetical protein